MLLHLASPVLQAAHRVTFFLSNLCFWVHQAEKQYEPKTAGIKTLECAAIPG